MVPTPGHNPHDLVAHLAQTLESEQRAAASVVVALREVATLLEQRIEEPALSAALETVAKVAAKWGRRGKAMNQLVGGFEAVVAAEAERRARRPQAPQTAAAEPVAAPGAEDAKDAPAGE